MRDIRRNLERFQRLCEIQFHPESPKSIIAPGKLHRVTNNDLWTIWKTELPILGLRTNQYPRIWFAQSGASIAFLCIGSHIDNYDDGTMDQLAISNTSDFF